MASSHWNNSPVANERSDNSIGSPGYFEDIRDYRLNYETPFIPSFFEYSRMQDKLVLEIGVGNGVDAVEILKSGATYTGIDITERHIELAKKNIELNGYASKASFVHQDLLQTEFENKFDIVYSFGVLHHIAHEENYLKKIHNVLKDDGKLEIALYSKYSFFNIYMFATWVVRNRMKNSFVDWTSHLAEKSDLDKPVYIAIRSKKEIVALLDRTGFKVVKYKKAGFVNRYLPVIGRFISPKSKILDFFAGYLGWYHAIIAEKK